MVLKNYLIKIHWLLSSLFGLNPILLWRSLQGLPLYLQDYWQFRTSYEGPIQFYPCLHDRYTEGGSTKNEYFWQDLLVARWIHAEQPQRHVDVGSRTDGFVAHVACFREIEVFDIRPIKTSIPGVVFRQADLMNSEAVGAYTRTGGYCDSLSCLHALEHFSLGRYGDPINPLGYAQGLKTMSSLLKPCGKFYLSTPIGRERVEFNANWVFDPRTIIHLAESEMLKLNKLAVITRQGIIEDIDITEDSLIKLAEEIYNFGIFVFVKEN